MKGSSSLELTLKMQLPIFAEKHHPSLPFVPGDMNSISLWISLEQPFFQMGVSNKILLIDSSPKWRKFLKNSWCVCEKWFCWMYSLALFGFRGISQIILQSCHVSTKTAHIHILIHVAHEKSYKLELAYLKLGEYLWFFR